MIGLLPENSTPPIAAKRMRWKRRPRGIKMILMLKFRNMMFVRIWNNTVLSGKELGA